MFSLNFLSNLIKDVGGAVSNVYKESEKKKQEFRRQNPTLTSISDFTGKAPEWLLKESVRAIPRAGAYALKTSRGDEEKITPGETGGLFGKLEKTLYGNEPIGSAQETYKRSGGGAKGATLAGLGIGGALMDIAPGGGGKSKAGKEVVEKASEAIDPVKKIISALKETKPLREATEKGYTAQRGVRAGVAKEAFKTAGGGEAGAKAELGALKGAYEKATTEGVRSQLTQTDIDSLINKIHETPQIDWWDSLTAKTGLMKVLDGGETPTRGELNKLETVFGSEFTKQLSNSTWKNKAKTLLVEAANTPRALMSSIDMSAPFRQGLVLSAGHPIKASKAFGQMFKYFGSQKYIDALNQEIASKPTYDLAKEAGLSFTGFGKTSFGSKEEQFRSNFAEKIGLVRASERAYTGFLNKLRSDVFDDLAQTMMKNGIDPQKDIAPFKSVAKFVDAASGRGGLGKLDKYATELNATFFSPRLIASRVHFLNPVTYLDTRKQNAVAVKEAWKSVLSLGTAGVTILSLAKMGGADVETDPRSSDFGKIKTGNTRIDISGGFQPYVRLAAQLALGEKKSTRTGKTSKIGEAYGSGGRLDTAIRFARGKLAPSTAAVVDILKGSNLMGEQTTLPREAYKNLVPLYMQDISDAWNDVGAQSLAVSGLPAFFGVGVQTYSEGDTSKPGSVFQQPTELQKKSENKRYNRIKKRRDYGFSDEFLYRLTGKLK